MNPSGGGSYKAMATFQAIITFSTNAIAIIGTSGITGYPTNAMAKRIFFEPLRANSHACWMGLSDVTNTGTGAAVKEFAQPPAATIPMDSLQLNARGDSHNLDPTVYFVHGTSGEKIKVFVDTI